MYNWITPIASFGGIILANIKQVAELAGVSTATVSKYLNGVTVRDKNKEAIDRAIKELDYSINSIARGLRTSRSCTVGILIPDLRFSFFTAVISDIENRLEEHGYSTIICDYKSDPELEAKKIRFLLSKQVDAIIIAPVGPSYEATRDVGVPIVYIDQMLDDPSRDYVVVDNAKASYNALKHIISMGHERVGLINGPMSAYTARERLKGYYSALCDAGIAPDSRYIKSREYDIPSGHDLTCELLDLPEPPTAIFATNSDLTMGAVLALNERHASIGRDISLVGFDNFEVAEVVTPKLTIVSQPIEEIGAAAVSVLMRRLEDDGEPGVVMLETELVIQGSVSDIKNK